MSRNEYINSQRIEQDAYTFNAIIMAAMRHADSIDLELLQDHWPEQWEELGKRYHAPAGYLEGER